MSLRTSRSRSLHKCVGAAFVVGVLLLGASSITSALETGADDDRSKGSERVKHMPGFANPYYKPANPHVLTVEDLEQLNKLPDGSLVKWLVKVDHWLERQAEYWLPYYNTRLDHDRPLVPIIDWGIWPNPDRRKKDIANLNQKQGLHIIDTQHGYTGEHGDDTAPIMPGFGPLIFMFFCVILIFVVMHFVRGMEEEDRRSNKLK